MAAIDDLKAILTSVASDVTTISANVIEVDGDVQEVLDKLAALSANTGGIDAAGVAELTTLLGDVKTSTGVLVSTSRAAADKVPEPTI